MLRVLNKYSFSLTITNSKFYYIRFLFFFLILICRIYYAIKVINILHNYVVLNLIIITLSVSLIEGICNISIVASSIIISLSNLILFFDHHLKYGSAHGTKAVDWWMAVIELADFWLTSFKHVCCFWILMKFAPSRMWIFTLSRKFEKLSSARILTH